MLIALAALLALAMAPKAEAEPADTSQLGVESLVNELGLAPEEASRRLEAQDRLAALAERLSSALGARAAGTWIDLASGELRVNVLDDAAAQQVRAAGAQPQRVQFSLERLEAAKAALDRAGGASGLAWAVDVPTNSIVVSVPQGAADAETAAFLETAQALGVPVRVEQVASAPVPHAFYGGEAVTGSTGGRCSAGFITQARSGNQYIVTAGHCTNSIRTWYGDGQRIGNTAASSFPGNDYGAIRIDNPSALDPQGAVLNNGRPLDITHAGRVPVNSTVCKTGSTTQTTCGRVLRYNATVRYAQGTVSQLTETTVCSRPGDSGGALFAGSQAQGVTSGGSTIGCGSSFFRSYFQPVDEILNAYGLTLR